MIEAVEHGSWGIYGFGSRYPGMTGEDTAEWEDLVRAVVNSRVCDFSTTLQVLLFTRYTCPINPITNPISLCSHLKRDRIPSVVYNILIYLSISLKYMLFIKSLQVATIVNIIPG
jgi:hypothetical protein